MNLMKATPDIMSNADSNSDAQILDNIRRASEIIAVKKNSDCWLTDDDQVELLRKIEFRSRNGLVHFDDGLVGRYEGDAVVSGDHGGRQVDRGRIDG